ncbi:MAG: 2-amino-3,7-dideoxy-D-threo-hept-6-ulosonate synthase [Archaeoglobaceae archaeon]|nr:2-amino-3,7-dideoxy-D-threo-hept-6-ulosonate synthase [Archaeoglobaceae archaeon]MDW7989256.1 2-amino-3,7-dideoxy-D-threo-hept-6-ulosonate synthase [Archaeoglobaceae archaeon]
MTGKKRRLKRILKNGKTLIMPADHGVTKIEQGLENIDELIRMVCDYIDAVVLHKGIVKNSKAILDTDIGLIVHLSASTYLCRDPNDKRIVSDVESVLKLGGDAVSVHVNIGSDTEGRQLEELGKICDQGDSYGIPVLAMMYPRGNVEVNVETVKQSARVGYELGADIVKVPYVENFPEVIRYCKIPIVIAGGSKGSEIELLKRVEKVMREGASGIAVGRNVFSSSSPRDIAKALYDIIHEGMSVEEVLENERNMVISGWR